MIRFRVRLSLLLLGLVPAGLSAQNEAGVAVLAQVLANEDARTFNEALFRRALADPDSSIRREAARALGRLRDPAGIPLLAPILLDPDSTVQATVIFALGLIGDSSAVPALVTRSHTPPALSFPSALELISALARIGGGEAAGFVASVLNGDIWADRSDAKYLAQRAALESWRLGSLAPGSSLISRVLDTDEDMRIAAVYSLGRLRVKAAASRLVEAAGDKSVPVRATAVRALSKSYADSAGLSPSTVADVLARSTRDVDAGVRIQALRSLATFKDPTQSDRIAPLLDDPMPNVQVEAATSLGALGGPAAATALTRILASGKGFARRREALISLARVDTAAFATKVGPWASGTDWRERAAAAEGWAWVRPAAAAPFLKDNDPRVVAAALQAWSDRAKGPDPELLSACRQMVTHRDAAVRSLAADGIARGPVAGDLPLLIEAFKASGRDSFPEAAVSALNGIVAFAHAAPDGGKETLRNTLGQLPPPSDYVVRRWAEDNWPEAAARWGPSSPIATGRTLEDYRDIVRRFQVGFDSTRYPTIYIDVVDLGTVEVQLFGPDAPLTVANFLRLADRHFFDGQRFHRVVPNFVVQAGDPRGDGWGGPGTTIRDEINQRRYGAYYLGMALSGPDTGGSQWFITLSPQPHLDGMYTIFGKVTDGAPVLLRITQGDAIRSIHH